jgi:hypothetical protein
MQAHRASLHKTRPAMPRDSTDATTRQVSGVNAHGHNR